jgi:succinylglutamic semialdehyde dehydrogenase
LIVVGKQAFESLVDTLQSMLKKVRIGLPLDEKQPFMGPLVNAQSAINMLAAQDVLLDGGAQAIVRSELDDRCDALISPGLAVLGQGQKLQDEEHFGPLLVAQAADDLDHAVAIANDTEYGLSAGYIGDRAAEFRYFLSGCRAGIVNWNRQTTGASGKLPFGGIGASGNHQPSGFFASDYCSYPVASLEAENLLDLSGSIRGLND